MVHCHPNAKLTPRGRAQVFEAVEAGMTVTAACLAFGVSRRCYYRWWPRWLASRDDGPFDRSSRPHHAPCQLTGWEVAQIVRLRLERGWGPDRIGAWLQLNPSTVHRVINRLGLFSEKARPEPSRRYEHREPGGLLHLDVKKLGQIGDGPGHRAHGDRTRRSRGVGWEYLYIAIDDCTRLVYCELLGEETGSTATGFLLRALRWLRDQGIRVRRLLTDNGSCFKSKLLNRACRRLAINHIYTRPYRPQTNGKVERWIRTALSECLYLEVFHSPERRAAALRRFVLYYNEQRPHLALHGLPPRRRLLQAAA